MLIQIFSPLLASQRIMMCQFDNAYTAIQMENSLNVVFDEVSRRSEAVRVWRGFKRNY